ncbi:MAG: OmpP1/FadL family transporter [Candidatus Aminicenantia bacterium]
MFKKFIIISLPLFLVSSILRAGGWDIYLMGTRALSMATAFTGVADDPSAIFYNPAGLVYQNYSLSFSVEGVYLMPVHSYTLPTGTTVYSKYRNTLPQVFLSYKKDKWSFGFGAYVSYGGGGIDWSREELDLPLKAILGVYSFTPTVAYQLNDKLSLGFNLNIYYGKMEVNIETLDTGKMTTDETGTSYSAGFGILYRPNKKIGIGLTIRGPAKMKLAGSTTMNIMELPLNFDSESKFNLPLNIDVGLSYHLRENFLISGDVGYTRWSTLQKLEGTIKNVPVAPGIIMDVDKSEEINFQDIFKFKIGGEYVFPQGVALRVGFAYDNYARPDSTLSVRDIDVDKIVLFGGIGYRIGKAEINFAGLYALGKERQITETSMGFPLVHKYNLDATVISLGVRYSF